MPLNPLKCTQEISDSYISYLLTALPFRDGRLRERFEARLREPERMVKGPILEATPAFVSGRSVRQLVQDGIAHRYMLRLQDFPLDRPLYSHQEEAFLKALGGRNLVIATGTGSGKTECFLFPIIHGLLSEPGETLHRPGVRALLLYPMNALANDQVRRLRRLLADLPEITFGRYTGETRETPQEALKHFRRNYPREPRVPNELLSRDEMRERPPHILLTNHAMLEYLLLRPRDHELFDGRAAEHWRFVAVDEAHTFGGAVGIETAYLLRRLRHRVSRQRPLQFFATSATLGGGREDHPEVVDFACSLFNAAFEWDEGDPGRQDVVRAQRRPHNLGGPTTTALRPEAVTALHRLFLESEDAPDWEDVELILEAEAFPPERIARVGAVVAEPENGEGCKVSRTLHEIMRDNSHLSGIRDHLAKGPCLLSSVISSVPELAPYSLESLVALVALGARAREDEDSLPLLPARYHVFARALEGCFLRLEPEPELYLDRRLEEQTEAGPVQVYEAATCRACGQHFLFGEGESGRLGGVKTAPIGDEYTPPTYFMPVDEANSEAVEDEDEDAAFRSVAHDHRLHQFCPRCGRFWSASQQRPSCEECGSGRLSLIMEARTASGEIPWCPACGGRTPGGIASFQTGQDATTSVLATALYRALPELEVTADEDAEADWSMTVEPALQPRTRKLLAFSDSRQDSAFFACYLGRTYNQICRRALIYRTFREKPEGSVIRLADLVEPLMEKAHRLGLTTPQQSDEERKREILRWLMFEFLVFGRDQGLEGTGLLAADLVPLLGFVAPRPLRQVPWELDNASTWTLFGSLLDTMRVQGAVLYPEPLHPKDEFFAPRNRPYYFRESGSDPEHAIFSWCSAGKQPNRRTELLTRFLQTRGLSETQARQHADTVLKKLWEAFTTSQPWSPYFHGEGTPQGPVFRLNPTMWRLRRVTDADRFACDTCGRIAVRNLGGLCPRYRCLGHLEPAPLQGLRPNHYRSLYTEMEPFPMRVQEHTAQLKSARASELQDEFLRGLVNVLSCSTTFELGVDVGELEAAFLRNVPPETANYVQRAGRAGRRTSGTAFVLTYAQRRSHDLTYFAHPLRMVSGQIRPPRFSLANDKIARRHLHAVVLSDFFRSKPEYFGNVEAMFERKPLPGNEAVQAHVGSRPAPLERALQEIFSELTVVLGISDWSWQAGLTGPGGSLARAQGSHLEDIETLEALRQEQFQQEKDISRTQGLMRRLRRERLINRLCSRGVLPKYGFPVDVVELRILQDTTEAGQVELTRDLRVAISEFAPGCEVVAAGRLWRSYALCKPPRTQEWKERKYAVCASCGRYQRKWADEGDFTICCACGERLPGLKKVIFPEFGFQTASFVTPGLPGERRPQRTFSSRVFFAEYDDELAKRQGTETRQRESVHLPGGVVDCTYSRFGMLAVINDGRRSLFGICRWCGHGDIGSNWKKSDVKKGHRTPWDKICTGPIAYVALGHEFMTDVTHLDFASGGARDDSFWLSLLYAVLEGASEVLHIRRQDLDGCLYVSAGSKAHPVVVLLDNVPGGAGHVARIRAQLTEILAAALRRLSGQCGCAEETSCYGCLRNFGNQHWHDRLARGPARGFLLELLGHVERRAPGGDGKSSSTASDMDLFPPAWQKLVASLTTLAPHVEVKAGEDVFDGDRVVGGCAAVFRTRDRIVYAVDASLDDFEAVVDALRREGREALPLDPSDGGAARRCAEAFEEPWSR